ncbi:hypothetical protein ILUMI_00419 [Ignelater luminosus]|uniref:Uncharacterized protein n=1 Tax=Ignelater luminosus TaxID=2038154 RepID=A0A8K0GMN4_IGNLU|nr:hypothetical protein ILUMI_00419 [Ignelater luminosus]
MLKVMLLAMWLVAAYAKPAAEEVVPIVSQESSVEADGHYHYSYESGDGSKATQDGELKEVDKEHAGEAVVGSFEYKGDDGQTYHVEYTADENGYVPHGDHIPAIPEAIARALKWAEEHPYKEPEQKH